MTWKSVFASSESVFLHCSIINLGGNAVELVCNLMCKLKVWYCPERWPRSLSEPWNYPVYNTLGNFNSSGRQNLKVGE